MKEDIPSDSKSKKCAITFDLHDKLIYSFAIIVVFNNVNWSGFSKSISLHPHFVNVRLKGWFSVSRFDYNRALRSHDLL